MVSNCAFWPRVWYNVGMDSAYVITRYDQLSTLVAECPRAAELLAEYGLHCVNCFANEYDTLEMGAQVHGMSDEEMAEMIDEINGQLEKEFKNRKSKVESTS